MPSTLGGKVMFNRCTEFTMRFDQQPGGRFSDETTDDAKRRALRVAGWFLLAGPALYLLLIALSYPDQIQRGLGPALVMAMAAATLLLLRAGKARSAAWVLAYGVFVGLMPAVILNGGLQAPQVIALPLVILLAGWLLGARHALVLTALAIAFVLGLAAYPADLPTPPTKHVLSALPLIVVLLIAGLLTAYIVRSNDSQLNQVRRLGEALAAEKSQLAQIAENVPALIFHGDRELVCRYANRQFADFFHGGGVPVEGMHLRTILGEEVFEAALPNINRALAGESILLEGERKAASGSMRHLEISLVPDRSADGSVVGFYALKRDITERQKIEQALVEREAELRLVMESVPVMLFHGDSEQRCLYANRNYAAFYAAERENLTGMTVREIIGEAACQTGVEEKLDRVLAGERISYRAVRRSAAGEERMLDIEMVPEPGKAGQACGFFAVFKDVTDQVHAEEALRRSEDKFAKVFRSSPLAIAISRLSDGRYLDLNDALERLLGWRRDEIIGRTSLEIGAWLTPEERHSWAAALRQAGRVSNQEVRLRTRNGDIREVLQSAELIELEGEPCALVMAADISERKQAEEKFAKIFQASPVAISIARLRDGQYLDVNEAFVRQFGWSREEIVGRTSLEIGVWRCPADRDRWVAELCKSGRLKSYEASLRIKSGEQRTVLMSAEPLSLNGEECVLNSAHDITELRLAEVALRESEARLREAQRIGRFGSWELDLASMMFTWSEEITHIFETTMPPGSVSYETFLANIHPEDREAFDKAYKQTIAEGKSNQFTYRLCMPDGRIKFVHVRAETLQGADGKPVKAIGTTQDITEQQLAQQEIHRLNAELESRVRERTAELQSANKELESFAYSISHDLRAPLRGIDGFSHLLAEEYGERLDAQGKSYLERVRAAAQRMGTLIDDILELSRVTRHSMRRSQVDLSRLAHEILDELKQGAPARTLTVSIAEGCTAFGDPQLLRVMMQNLLENAWKYSGREAAPRIEFGREAQDGETVLFVRDNGVGFDMKYADRLFTPFQRLHKPEEFAGTGIGLATVARVVRRHGGRVWAESEPEKGATLRFTLADATSIGQ